MVKLKRVIKTILVMLFFCVMLSYDNFVLAENRWDAYSVEEYEEALSGDAGMYQGLLAGGAPTIDSNNADDYIKRAEAFQRSEGWRFLDVSLQTPINDRIIEAENKKSGEKPEQIVESEYEGKSFLDIDLEVYESVVPGSADYNALYNSLIYPSIDVENMNETELRDYVKKIKALRDKVNDNYSQTQSLDALLRDVLDKRPDATDDSDIKDVMDDTGVSDTDADGTASNKGNMDKYYSPDSQKVSKSQTLDDMLSDAEKIKESGSKISQSDIKNFSNRLYNIFLSIGTVIAVIVGAILGVQFMLASVEGKAEIKKMLVAYAVGCGVVFGAFGIWKIVVTILQNI